MATQAYEEPRKMGGNRNGKCGGRGGGAKYPRNRRDCK